MPGPSRPAVLPPRLHRVVLALAWLGALAALASCGVGDEPKKLHTTKPAPATSGSISIIARQPMLPTFPCSRCHAGRAPNEQERKLTEFHTQKVLAHGTEGGWCYRCHTKDNIDHLHLPDGKLVSFDEAYELCGGCHGDKLRDWKAGIHGLTTGFWSGDRERRSCPACHDPHAPKFPLMTPEHAPQQVRTAPRTAHNANASEEQHVEE